MTYCPTTSVTNSVERLISEISATTFPNAMRDAAKAGWNYIVLGSAVLEGFDALEWAIPQLLAVDMFTSNPFKLLIRGELCSSNPTFEIGVSWNDVSDLNFIENAEDCDCDWIDPDKIVEMDVIESELDRLSNPADIVNKVLAKFAIYKETITFPTELSCELIHASKVPIDAYEPNDFDAVILENLKHTLVRHAGYEWKKDTHVYVSAIWPFDEGITLKGQWFMCKLSEVLLPLHVIPMRIITPDGEHIGLIREQKIVYHLDV